MLRTSVQLSALTTLETMPPVLGLEKNVVSVIIWRAEAVLVSRKNIAKSDSSRCNM